MERRLQRSKTDRLIFGVCGGLAEYFDIDATLVRLILVLLTFAGGSGLLAYIIMAIVMPSDSSTATQPRDVVRDNIAEMRSTARGMGDQIRGGLGDAEGAEPSTVPSQREELEDRPAQRRQSTAGAILILIGVLFLLSNFGFFRLDMGRLWPLILIGIGAAILYQRSRRA